MPGIHCWVDFCTASPSHHLSFKTLQFFCFFLFSASVLGWLWWLSLLTLATWLLFCLSLSKSLHHVWRLWFPGIVRRLYQTMCFSGDEHPLCVLLFRSNCTQWNYHGRNVRNKIQANWFTHSQCPCCVSLWMLDLRIVERPIKTAPMLHYLRQGPTVPVIV